MSAASGQDHSGRWLAIAASVVVVATVVVAVLVMDPPSAQRDARLDSRRIDELNHIVQVIDTHVQVHGELPPDLGPLAAQPGRQLAIADPVTGLPYEYTTTGGLDYTLCAVFASDTAEVRTTGVAWNFDEWSHDVGRHCFTRTAKAPKRKSEPQAQAQASTAPVADGSPTARLAVEGDGLRVFTLPSGSARPISFGTGKAETLKMLQAVLGAPPASVGDNVDCGATRARWPGGLTVWFVDEAFAGWSLGPDGSGVSTVDGIAIGSTRDALESGGSVVAIAPSSLGTEFSAGNVAGLLGSADADAVVTHLWAGQACIAR